MNEKIFDKFIGVICDKERSIASMEGDCELLIAENKSLKEKLEKLSNEVVQAKSLVSASDEDRVALSAKIASLASDKANLSAMLRLDGKHFPVEVLIALSKAIADHNRTQMMKLFRDFSGVTLGEAKKAVDDFMPKKP